jgi:hypothetical protein
LNADDASVHSDKVATTLNDQIGVIVGVVHAKKNQRNAPTALKMMLACVWQSRP